MRQKMFCLCLASAVLLLTAAQAQSIPSIYEQAADYIQRGQSPSAIALLEPRLRATPGDLKALTLMGLALAAENRREPANRYFKQVLNANPRFAPALKNLAINELALGENENAKKHLLQLLQLTPADPMAHLALGEIEFGSKNYRSA